MDMDWNPDSKPQFSVFSGAATLPSRPSPEKVHAVAAEIRQNWSPHERRYRAFLARYFLLRQLILV